MDNEKDQTQEHQPWDDLEFGTSMLSRGDVGSGTTSKARTEAKHVEHATEDEAFWQALKAENQSRPSVTVDGSAKAQPDVTVGDRRWSLSGLDLPRINSRALAAAQSEHSMTFREGLRDFPKAIFWSALISLAIIGEGFDTSLINSFYAYRTFKRSYGVLVGDGTYEISTKWQSSLNNGAVAGSIVGLLANGWLSERFGYRRTLMFAVVWLAACIFLTFFAFNIETLLAGQILCGVPWGICSTLTISYASEVMPLALRGYLVANINLCWIIGQIIALGTLRGFLDDGSEWSYRIPFAIQWAFALVVFIASYLAPESPWWLVRQRKFDEARKVLVRLGNKTRRFNPDNVLAMMQHTDTVEKQLNNGKAERNDVSYLECFRGTNLRRTEIACVLFMAQNMCGLPLTGFAAYAFQRIGFSSNLAFNLTLGMHGLAVVACLLALGLITRFGRRRIILWGLTACFFTLLTAAALASVPESTPTLWAQASMSILFIFVFNLSMGPLTYSVVAEVPSTRLKVHTVVLARIAYNINALVTNIIQSHALNPLSWNLRGKTNYIWAFTCLCCLVYAFARVPETRGLTYHELDILFEKKAGARKFGSIQKRLEETGYFGFYERQSDASLDAAWT